jgi:hypothetical protein
VAAAALAVAGEERVVGGGRHGDGRAATTSSECFLATHVSDGRCGLVGPLS